MATATSPSGTARTAWARNLAAPIRSYLHAETGGAIALAAAAIAALIWANVSPQSYADLWDTRFALRLGSHELGTDLREWVNQGLMTLFFLVVGLEAKRELDLGELRERSRIAVPVLAALGGMICAGGLYLLLNVGGDGAAGWGAAVSTDTALALGVLSVVTRGRATRLRVFLLTMVVIDDLVALLVIALGYTEEVDAVALLVAIALFAGLYGLRWTSASWRGPVALALGVGVWIAMFESGVDAVIAGLAIGLVTSAYAPARDDLQRSTELARSFREQPTPELAYSAVQSLTSAISRNERLQYRLHPWTSRVIVPLFALANAGVTLSSDLLSHAVRSPVTLGIVLAYAVGKPAGIVGAAALARRRGARLTVTLPALMGGATAAGVGFTVSLLVATLAFDHDRALLEQAKVGVLATALVAAASTWLSLQVMQRLPDELRARQLGNVAETIVDLAEDVDPAVDHVRGPLDAPVTLLEYGDFECPYCADAAPVIDKLRERLGDDFNYVFRHLPLTDVHPNAQLAAEAAEAAAAQGRFWEMHDRLLAPDARLGPLDLRRHAEALGLDVERFTDALRRRHHAPRIARDVQSADASGVSGTPTFFINGRRHQGVYDIETLARAVKAAARRPAVRA